jgi:hypothetical protein
LRSAGRIFTAARSKSFAAALLLIVFSSFPVYSSSLPADPADSGEDRRMLSLAGDLVIESLSCPFDTVILEQAGIPVSVRLGNTSGTSIVVMLVQLIFSENYAGDRNMDYVVTGDVTPEVTIPSGGSVDLELFAEVDKDAVTGRKINIDAYAFGKRLDNLESVSDSTSSETAFDRFDSVSFTGNDGSIDWETPWQELGCEDDGPGEGAVTVRASPVPAMGLSLSIGGPSFAGGIGAVREADLTWASQARLAFNWMRDSAAGLIGTSIRVQVSSDGIGWHDLQVIGEGFDSTPYISSFDITPYISPDTRIRFITASAGTGRAYFDNVIVNYTTESGAHSWTVLAEGLTSIFALFDTRMTADRSDDSLIVLQAGDVFQLDSDYHVADGAQLAEIPFEKSARYRLVIQLHSFTDWDCEPKETGQGSLSLGDPSQGIGRLSAPRPGVPEFLLSETLISDEELDNVDFVIGATKKLDPPRPWNMLTDPWADPEIDDGKLGEYGALIYGLDPARWHIDCRDGGKHWEVTGNCEKETYYFFETWFTPDLEWSHGDDADVQLSIDGHDGHGDIPGLHAHFRMIDDDIAGPVIRDFTPELVRIGETFGIYCRINDPSGVFDDATGSSGQGVYLIWDTDGDLDNGHNEVQMSLVADDLYVTDTDLSGFTEGEEIVYEVFAHDDDSDTGPGDRSLTVSSKQYISVLGSVALFDAINSLWPVYVYPAEQSVEFYIDLINPNPGDMRLSTSSFMMLTDGADTVRAFLSNETLLAGGVTGIPLRFESADIPGSFHSPDTVDIILSMEGLYDGSTAYSQVWKASYTNRLVILGPKVHFDASAVGSSVAHPGDRLVELLRMEVSCESMTAITLDSLTISDLGPVSSRSVAARSGNIEALRLYRQASPAGASGILREASEKKLEGSPGDVSGDRVYSTDGRVLLSDRPFDQSDSLIAVSSVENGTAVFVMAGGLQLGAWEAAYYYVVADIDSFEAVDGDPLIYGIDSPDSVHISGNSSISLVDDPLVSAGTPVIDGFMSFQASLVPDVSDTLYSGDEYAVIMIVDIPANGAVADILSGLSIVNYGNSAAKDVLESVVLWADDGDGVFSNYADAFEGYFQYTGDMFELTGLSIPVISGQRLFVTARIGYGFTTPLSLKMGIPRYGVEYVSGNDGPLERTIVPLLPKVLIRREFIRVESLLSPVELPPVRPGDMAAELMAVRLTNITLGPVDIDSMRVTGAADLFECEAAKEVRLHLDDGDGIFEAASDLALDSGLVSAGTCIFSNTNISIDEDEAVTMFVTADLDSMLTPDGDTLSVGIMSADDIYISASTLGPWDVDGIFPAGALNPRITDGMLSHQLALFPGSDSTVTGSMEDIQILDVKIPGNGCVDDTLGAISVVNLGTAGDPHIDRVLLWTDDGDGTFDPVSDDSIAVLNSLVPRTWGASGLSVPLDGTAGTRFFVTVDLVDGFGSGATIRAGIPRMGIEVFSGNDGPIDQGVSDENTIVIPIPDRVTFFASSLGNKRVHAGDEDLLNMVIGAYNSYDEPRTLGSIVLLQGGTARNSEISKVKAWVDSDENGLFDPELDGLLLEVEPAGILIPLEGLDFLIDPLQSGLLFITYTLPSSGVRDSVSIDMYIPDASLVGFEGNDIVVEGDFPLNSAGIDLTDGMTAAQVELIPVGGGRVSPGDPDVPCISMKIPCNGSEIDSLRGISIRNTGSCQPGIDISNLRLWIESGGTSGSFDEGEEIPLDLLVWDGSGWSSISGFSVPVDCAGLTVHVTADFAASAVDGRTLRACVPINGVDMSSGNDGPVDVEIVSGEEILVTTVPLLAGFEPLGKVTRGQTFEVLLEVSNVSDTVLTAVEPDSFSWAGDGSITLVSGPVPVNLNLPGAGSSAFTWTFRADSPGTEIFRARAMETGGSAISWFELSDTLLIEEIPDFVNVTLDDLSPVSLNRGHEDATLFEIMLIYGSACSGCAEVELLSFDVTFTDGLGQPVHVADVASRVLLEDETMIVFSCDTADSTSSSITLTPSTRIIMDPPAVKTLRFSLDVSDTAPASEFRASILSAADLRIADVNSGQEVAYGGTLFPWNTNTVSLKDPVTELSVDLVSTLPPAVNRGQSGIEAFDLLLTSKGGSSASDISISSIRFTTKNGSGEAAHPGGVLRKFRLEDDLGFGYFTAQTFPSPDGILCEFEPELRVSPGMPVALKARIDCLDEPVETVFSIHLADSLEVAARDVNSGKPVEILAGDVGGTFPMNAGPACFSDPLSGFSVSGAGNLPASIIAGMSGIDAVALTLSHTGSTGESRATISGISMRVLDQSSHGLAPRNYFDGIHVFVADTLAGSLFITAADTSSSMALHLDAPLFLDACESVVLVLRCDISYGAVPGIFQLMIGEGGFDIGDATDGERFNMVEGEFPMTSGLCRIVLPAESVGFRADPMLSENAASGADVRVFDAHFEFNGIPGGSDVLVESIRLEILDERGVVSDPSIIIESVRFDNDQGEIPSGAVMDASGITASLDDPYPVSDGAPLDFSIYLSLRGDDGSRAFSVRIGAASDISCRDEVTGGPVTVEAMPESAFPFVTSRTALLAASIKESFSNYPNPFVPARGVTRVTFYLPEPAIVSLELYTILGDLVTNLVSDRRMDAGLHQDITWDGRNGLGEPVASGVYLMVLKTNGVGGKETFRRKVSLIR